MTDGRALTATYRLQLHAGFAFADAAEALEEGDVIALIPPVAGG